MGDKKIKAFKGFDKDVKCRGFQYEVGKEYEEAGPIQACSKGFHACENPMDVFGYYPPADSRYCEVEQSGDISKDSDDSKIASSHIKIGAEIGLKGIIEAGVKFTMEKITFSEESVTTGYRAGAQATGYRAGAQATGDRAGAQATGTQAGAQATGYQAGAQATGTQAGAQATGYQAGATAIGYMSSAFADGPEAVACALGKDCKAKGTLGTLLVLVERGAWDGTGYPILDVKTRRVGKGGIKPDTWYVLRNGKVEEA